MIAANLAGATILGTNFSDTDLTRIKLSGTLNKTKQLLEILDSDVKVNEGTKIKHVKFVSLVTGRTKIYFENLDSTPEVAVRKKLGEIIIRDNPKLNIALI